jgi:hypothetical protein
MNFRKRSWVLEGVKEPGNGDLDGARKKKKRKEIFFPPLV